MYLPRGGDMRKEAYRVLNYVKTKGISPIAIWETQQSAGQAFSVTDVGTSFPGRLYSTPEICRDRVIDEEGIGDNKMRGSDHEKELRSTAITPQASRSKEDSQTTRA